MAYIRNTWAHWLWLVSLLIFPIPYVCGIKCILFMPCVIEWFTPVKIISVVDGYFIRKESAGALSNWFDFNNVYMKIQLQNLHNHHGQYPA